MSEDYRRSQPNEAALEQMVLRDIRDMLQSMGKDIKSYGLPDLVEPDGSSDAEYREVYEERQVPVDQEHLELIKCLNSDDVTPMELTSNMHIIVVLILSFPSIS
jgi:hypothetical protein